MTSRYMKKIRAGYLESAGIDEGYHRRFKVGKNEIDVYPPHRDYDGNMMQWTVIYDGALDYDGDKKGLIKRYPELREALTNMPYHTIKEPTMTARKAQKIKIGMRMFKI